MEYQVHIKPIAPMLLQKLHFLAHLFPTPTTLTTRVSNRTVLIISLTVNSLSLIFHFNIPVTTKASVCLTEMKSQMMPIFTCSMHVGRRPDATHVKSK